MKDLATLRLQKAYEVKFNKYVNIGKVDEFLQKVKEDGVEIEIL